MQHKKLNIPTKPSVMCIRNGVSLIPEILNAAINPNEKRSGCSPGHDPKLTTRGCLAMATVFPRICFPRPGSRPMDSKRK